MIVLLGFLVLGYLVGSASTAIIISRLLGAPDPRTQGSGNPGVNNVLRVAGKKAAVMVLIGETAKAALVLLLAKAFGVSLFYQGFILLVCVLGQMFPLFFNFQGGKGVAIAFGGVMAIAWQVGVASALVWLLMAALFRISSAASLAATWSVLIFVLWFGDLSLFLPFLSVAALITWRHHSNIRRLWQGTESRIGHSA